MIGIGASPSGTLVPTPTLGGGGGLAALLSSVSANGWQATYSRDLSAGLDPIGAPEVVTVQRAGFDASGAAVTVNDPLTLMAQVREPYPNQANVTADQVSLSDFVYSGDQIAGVTNNSTRTAPRPVAMWLTPDYERAISDTITVRMAVAHAHARAGRPVAAVRFEATGGGNTAVSLVSDMTPVTYAETGLTVPCFEATIDLSTLPEGLVTVDATIFPWVGAAFTLSSEGTTDSINIGPLTLVNDRAGGVGTAFAYVDPISGDDDAGIASRTEATAQAAPFATIPAAVIAARAVNSAEFGRDNAGGAVIVLRDGTHTWASIRSPSGATSFPIVLRGESRAGAVLEDAGASTNNSLPPHARFERMTIRKTGGSIIMLSNNAVDATPLIVLDDVALDRNGQSAYQAWIYRPGRIIAHNSDCADLVDAFGTVAKMVQMIGSTTTGSGSAVYNAAASRLRGFGTVSPAGSRLPPLGQLFSHCFVSQTDTAQKCVNVDQSIGSEGLAVIGSVLEAVNGDTAPAVFLNADGNTDPTENILFIGNTVVGSRVNWLYQDTGTARIEKSGYRRFNVQAYQNSKSDVFAANGELTGNWSEIYNVGSRANAALNGSNQRDDYSPGSWLGEVAALGDVSGTGAAPVNPDWALDASFAGSRAGGGDYRPGGASELPRVPVGLTPFGWDLNGQSVANGGTARIGACQS